MAKGKTNTYCVNCKHLAHGETCAVCLIVVGFACEGYADGEVEVVKEARPPTPLVIHIVEEVTVKTGPAMCGVTKGRAGNPSTATLVIDRWCSRCWNKWAKRKVKEAAA